MITDTKRFTLYLILADNLLNWVLGVLLTFFPKDVWTLLFDRPVYSMSPILTYNHLIFFGVCFLIFATWQVQVFLRRWKLVAKNLRIAAWLAWIPALLLTIGLLLPYVELFPVTRTLLWIGNVYMILLGAWYWWVAKKL